MSRDRVSAMYRGVLHISAMLQTGLALATARETDGTTMGRGGRASVSPTPMAAGTTDLALPGPRGEAASLVESTLATAAQKNGLVLLRHESATVELRPDGWNDGAFAPALLIHVDEEEAGRTAVRWEPVSRPTELVARIAWVGELVVMAALLGMVGLLYVRDVTLILLLQIPLCLLVGTLYMQRFRARLKRRAVDRRRMEAIVIAALKQYSMEGASAYRQSLPELIAAEDER